MAFAGGAMNSPSARESAPGGRFFFFALLSLLQATLTLPGIAGILLTVGMAVDAFFEKPEILADQFDQNRRIFVTLYAQFEVGRRWSR